MSDTTVCQAPLLTPQALRLHLSISYRTYSRLVRAGMPCTFVLTARRYDLAEVRAWLRAQASPVAGVTTTVGRAARRYDDHLVQHLKMLARGGRAR